MGSPPVADVFVSYVSEDRSIAEKIARGLEGAGFSVWWDRHIHGGVGFRKEIDRQLGAAKVVVVLWSAASLESEWVCDEAEQARNQKKLIPVRLDSVQPPLGFRQAQSLDFDGWTGDPNTGAFASLVNSARHFLAGGTTSAPVAMRPSAAAAPGRWGASKAWWLATAAIVVVLAAVVTVVLMRNHPSTAASELTNGRVELDTFEEITKDQDTTRFVAGLRNTLGHTLAGNGIKSVAANSSIAPGPSDAATSAELLLRGSVDRAQGGFKISADLVRRPEGLALWSIGMQGDPGEVDAVQKRFSVVVAEVLKCALANRSRAKDDPSSDLLAKFVQYCALFQGQGQFSQLEDFANQIVELAPRHAISHALKAIAAAVVANQPAVFGALLKPEEEQKRLHRVVDDSAKAGLELEPRNKRIEAIVDWALAQKNYNAGPVLASERMDLLERSLAADPQWGPARMDYAALLSRFGRIDESRSEFERAAGLMQLSRDPTASHAILVAAFGNVAQGRQELIDFEQRTGVRVDEDLFWLEYWYGDPHAAKAYAHGGHIPDLVLPGYTGGVPRCRDALLDARIRRAPMSQARFDAVCTHATPDLPAAFEAERGDVDAAFRELNYWAGWYFRNWQLSQSLFLPYMRSVRADPRFMPFAARIRLVDYWLDSGHWPDFCTTEKLPYDCKEAALAARANADGSGHSPTN
jgi:TolB-like protein